MWNLRTQGRKVTPKLPWKELEGLKERNFLPGPAKTFPWKKGKPQLEGKESVKKNPNNNGKSSNHPGPEGYHLLNG